MDEFWSEQRDDDSAYQAACADAELREWEAEQLQDRLVRHAPTGDSPKSVPA